MSDNSWKYSDFVSSLQRSLGNIGRRNGHAAPGGGSNLNPLIHSLLVDQIAYRYFDRQRKASLEEVLKHCGTEDIAAQVDQVIRTQLPDTRVLLSGDHAAVQLEVKRPASRLDTKRLRSLLEQDGRIPSDELDALFQAATTLNAPAKTFTVIPID